MPNLSSLKNIDIGSLLKSLFSNKTSLVRGPYAKHILWGSLGAILLFLYVFFIFWPNFEKRQEMQEKVDAIPQMEMKLKSLDLVNQKAVDDLHQAEKNYAELNQLFSVESELEELYQRLSVMASSQGMVISSLTKEGEEAIYPGSKANTGTSANMPVNQADAKNAKLGSPLFYRIKLKIELTGQYGRYMRYRKLLSEFDKSINIDKEQITLVPGDSRGMVVVKSQLSTYRLPNKLAAPTGNGNSINQTSVIFDDGLSLLAGSANANRLFVVDSGGNDPLAGPAAKSPALAASKNIAPGESLRNSEEIMMGNGADSVQKSVSQERDPFARSSSGMIEGGRDSRVSPLIMANPQAYVITGVIVSNSIKAAMVRTDYRESYVVKVGDRLGNQGGVIVDIDLDGIVIKQPNGKIRIYVQSQNGQPMGMPNGSGAR
jgi:Tfp pilus assembly protein PilO